MMDKRKKEDKGEVTFSDGDKDLIYIYLITVWFGVFGGCLRKHCSGFYFRRQRLHILELDNFRDSNIPLFWWGLGRKILGVLDLLGMTCCVPVQAKMDQTSLVGDLTAFIYVFWLCSKREDQNYLWVVWDMSDEHYNTIPDSHRIYVFYFFFTHLACEWYHPSSFGLIIIHNMCSHSTANVSHPLSIISSCLS